MLTAMVLELRDPTQNILGKRTVLPLVVRVKGVPLYLVLYPLDSKNPTGTVPNRNRTELPETQAAQPAWSLFLEVPA